MPSQPPLPPLLTPYLSDQPESSLTVISSVLGATSNWLVLRYLHASLSNTANSNISPESDGSIGSTSRRVVLVSFMRSWDFWKTEAKRLGLDLARLRDKRQFVFVDGLSELFTPPASASSSTVPIGSATHATLPLRNRPTPVPGRGPLAAGSLDRSAPNRPVQGDASNSVKLHFRGRGITALDAIEKDIISELDRQRASSDENEELLLIIDQLDLLLAATGPGLGIGATEMADWVMGLQQHAHATVLTIAADSPLIHNAATNVHGDRTPIETEHAALALGLAHRARTVMQLRMLETGAARDVSGVLRISRGGGWNGEAKHSLDEKELLYYIQRDGGLRVFGRGES
ncbi:Elongator complex protein 6 [Penicillium ucsense]|uniref:Elongator complex protein 6 n=1 Tax=Penicillium ucsense TaxID=2839758 RepID=A0A8J8W840_9EURO|nr:Elongator complex protein 6 [Penicillium ucsense]KAF7737132.1 Elongator complex protein 6 [Penicillium ucsense]